MKSKHDKDSLKTPNREASPAKSRENVMRDFRKIAGPLRGQNRDRKPKP